MSHACQHDIQWVPGLQVAIALGLLTAEVSAPPFNQLVCTFSEKPQLHHIKEGSLVDKVGWQGCTASACALSLYEQLHRNNTDGCLRAEGSGWHLVGPDDALPGRQDGLPLFA